MLRASADLTSPIKLDADQKETLTRLVMKLIEDYAEELDATEEEE